MNNKLLTLEEIEEYIERLRGENEVPAEWEQHFLSVAKTARAAMKVVESLRYMAVMTNQKPYGWDEVDKAFAPFRKEK